MAEYDKHGRNRFVASDTGEQYFSARMRYPEALYDYILSYHKGPTSLAIDLGCGPGLVAEAIAPRFKTVIGVDPSDSMLAAARKHSTNGNVIYRKGYGENLQSCGIAEGSVDLIVGGTSAHWLDHEVFYRNAAKMLRPTGTIAFFTNALSYAAPSVRNYEGFNHIMSDFRQQTYQKFKQTGNTFVEELYSTLPVPEHFDALSGLYECAVHKAWDAEKEPENASRHFFLTVFLTMHQHIALQKSYGPISAWITSEFEAGRNPDEAFKTLAKELSAAIDYSEGEKLEFGAPMGCVLIRRRNAENVT